MAVRKRTCEEVTAATEEEEEEEDNIEMEQKDASTMHDNQKGNEDFPSSKNTSISVCIISPTDSSKGTSSSLIASNATGYSTSQNTMNEGTENKSMSNSTKTTTTKSSRGKPNKLLTDEERNEKRRLKKRLKIQQKIKKLHTRIKHAISRKDPMIESKTRLELESLKEKISNDDDNDDQVQFLNWDDNGDLLGHQNRSTMSHSHSRSVESEVESDEYKKAKRLVLDIVNELFMTFKEARQEQQQQQQQSSGSNDNEMQNNKAKNDHQSKLNHTTSTAINNTTKNASKEHQTQCAVELLKNMTKGTIKLSMFDNKAALLGYTRQKFYERAMLLYTSLNKLKPNIHDNDVQKKKGHGDTDHCLPQKQREIKDKMWKKIQNGCIRKVCSIGCGPGNDATGLLTFLHCNEMQSSSPSPSQTNLDEVTLMDWSIEQWEDAILKSLASVLNHSRLLDGQAKDNNGKNQKQNVFKTCFCDVTTSYTHESNSNARDSTSKMTSCCDMYLTSYLLSETNGKWESFYDGMIKEAQDESLFYFAEPTPWQLHRLIELFSHKLDFLWVDSSMYHPSLQSLDGRLGPAVLFAIKNGIQ